MKVLFVCSGNAYRSPVAEALFRKLRPDIEADSAGTDPAIPISDEAHKYLAMEDAERYLKSVPEGLNRKQLAEYNLIVVMEARHKEIVVSKCPECRDKVIVWNIDDPYFLPHGYAEKIFKQIKEKVSALANSL